MVSNPSPDVTQASGSTHNYVHSAGETRAQVTTRQALQGFDSQAWRATCKAPFRFARWLAALLTAIAGWLVVGTQQSAAAYLPALGVVVLLMLPDAQSIAIAGLKFDRLRDEVASQQAEVSRLRAEILSINSSIASSQVHIAFAAAAMDATAAAEGHRFGEPDLCSPASELGGPGYLDHERQVAPDHEPLLAPVRLGA